MFGKKPLKTFLTKSGKKIEIWPPEMSRLPELLEFVNRLVKEDSFLSFNPEKEITEEEEKKWLKRQIEDQNKGNLFLVWAVFQGKIIGSCDITRGGSFRDAHVGKIGLMVDKDFRREGIGKNLLEFIIERSKKMKLQIVSLTVFSDNVAAILLYKKIGFKEWGRLPKGLYRQGKYSDSVKLYLRVKE